jgi:PAT family beta-lactamase induction signal transducer AmpG
MNPQKKTSPWAWIPTLYFAQGLPYVAVMTISVIMYKRLGISNTDIALYTSWLYLPWVIKPFWSPFIDLLKTKRWWVVTMQMLVGAGLAGIAFTIPARPTPTNKPLFNALLNLIPIQTPKIVKIIGIITAAPKPMI